MCSRYCLVTLFDAKANVNYCKAVCMLRDERGDGGVREGRVPGQDPGGRVSSSSWPSPPPARPPRAQKLSTFKL